MGVNGIFVKKNFFFKKIVEKKIRACPYFRAFTVYISTIYILVDEYWY
jgi:hypothetical protein